MPIPLLHDFIAADMRAVDAIIRNRLTSDVVLVRQVAEYIVGGGGKRLRPALVILSAGAFRYTGKHHYQLAARVTLSCLVSRDDTVAVGRHGEIRRPHGEIRRSSVSLS